ncbi:MAG: dethiobiotin synthase [Alphaproteobacteria bacterium]|nr:dethiobiotin synthase [Alphaproteobacteria bacterium]
MKRLFVTGSGTGVGKTLVTAALTHQLRRAGRTVRAIKPVVSGYTPATHRGSDTALLLDSLDAGHSAEAIDRVSPFRFAAPLSPDMAAARESRRLDYGALLRFCRDCADGPEEALLIEGVGGVMVPLTEDKTVLDWMAAAGAPCLLVVGSYLGTISHTLTAVEALRSRGVVPAGLVISESEESPVPPAETQAAIRRFVADIPIVVVPRVPGDRPWRDVPDLTFLLA